MTQQTATHTHVFADKASPGRYWAKSWHPTEGTTHYGLGLNEFGATTCTCKGWEFRYVCRHTVALARRLERDSKRRQHRQPAQLRTETVAALRRLYPEAA